MSDFTLLFPSEILAELFLAAIEPGSYSNNLTRAIQLASTCRRLYDVYWETRSIWVALFCSRYDVREHHLDPSFDIKAEFIDRAKGLANKNRDIYHPFIIEMVSESVNKNLAVLHEMCSRESIHSQLLEGFVAISENRSSPANWFAVVQALVLSDQNLANDILHVQEFKATLLQVGRNHFDGKSIPIPIFQLFHLYMFSRLYHHSLTEALPVPLPQFNTTAEMLGYKCCQTCENDLLITPERYLPSTLSTLSDSWAGYYTYGLPLQRRQRVGIRNDHFDPPMRFTLKVTNKTVGEAVASITGKGSDGVGAFTINGEISKSARVRLVKFYTTAGHSWQYLGLLLPGKWGIIGDYGFGLQFRHFWLWPVGQD